MLGLWVCQGTRGQALLTLPQAMTTGYLFLIVSGLASSKQVTILCELYSAAQVEWHPLGLYGLVSWSGSLLHSVDIS